MSFEACAALVERADADRFAAAMACDMPARRVLMPIYAANAEIARAPYAATEPLIAEMRLQWWRDVMEEIARGGPVRAHEVTTPLSEVLTPPAAGAMRDIADARSWDVDPRPFADEDAVAEHVGRLAGNLSWASALSLGAPVGEEGSVREIGTGGGIAAWLCAVPAYRARGVEPLHDASGDAIRSLAQRGLGLLRRPSRAAAPAVLWTWQAKTVLKQAHADPRRVEDGTLGTSEFRRRGALLLRSIRG